MPIIDNEEPTTWIYLLRSGGWITYDPKRLDEITFTKEEAIMLASEKKVKNNPFVKARPISFIGIKESISDKKVVVRHLNRQGRVRWILDTLPLVWTKQKNKATDFKSYDQALEYVNHVGLDFASIEEVEV